MNLARVIILSIFIVNTSCHTAKTPTTDNSINNATSMKANLIDGNWEPNYIVGATKPLDELYPVRKPNINFNSEKGMVTGFTGCNSLSGKINLNGNRISWSEGMAITKKMCPEEVVEQERLFLETLKKANTYSVTEQGKTLNLIMGDMAIMRLTRK